MSDYQARPYVLAETNWNEVKRHPFQVAILPWGATEAHNYHLPYATDNIQAEHVAIQSAKLAWEQNVKTVVLPCVPFGVNTGQMDIALCLNMNPSTQLALLQDLVVAISNAGINKLVILNGHGGNSFKHMIRELSLRFPQTFICSVNWYQVLAASHYFDEPGDHAGELETSCLLHLAAHWVRPLSEAGDGAAKSFRIKALNEGWISTQRPWTQVTTDTGVGNPKAATSEKGKRFLNAACDKIGHFLIELAESDLDDMFE